MARPRLDKNRRIVTCVTIDQEIKEKAQAKASYDGLTLSSLINVLLRRYTDNKL